METQVKRIVSEFNQELKLKGFNVFRIEDDSESTRTYSRKDFYKICLTTGKSVIHYADRSFEADDTVLFLGNPNIPYSWETKSTRYVGYTCLFSEEFFQHSDRSESLLKSPLFKIGGTPLLKVSQEQREYLNSIFQRMIEEQDSDYIYKDELIRNHINTLLHEALKLQPSENFDTHNNAASRITRVFQELLERQFPIEKKDTPLQLKTAGDFAANLNIHTNYLNRSVKEITGRSTSDHISERIANEAKALLQHTDWNISEIAYSLGFEYPTYFNNFFRKQTNSTPSAFREKV